MRKKTLGLLIINLLLFFLISRYLQEDKVAKDKDHHERNLFALAFTDIRKIAVSRGKTARERVLLSRNESKWLLHEPLAWPANFFAARGILNGLQHIEATPLFSTDEIRAEGESLKDYGLDFPALTIEVTGRHEPVQLRFGTETPDKTRIYALEPQSQKVYAVDKGLIDDLNQPLASLMRPEFFDLQVNEIRSLSIRFNQDGTTSKTTISRIDPSGDSWKIVAPIEATANGHLVKGLVNQLLSARVARFVMEPQLVESIAEKLASPNVSVTLEGALRSQTLAATELVDEGDFKGLRYARLEGSPTMFSTSDALFQELRNAQRNLREKRFMRFESKDVDSIEIAKGSRKISLHLLEQNEWQAFARMGDAEIAQFPADANVIDGLLTNLKEAEAESFVDAPSETDLVTYGLLPANLTIKLGMASGEDRILLVGENHKENGVYAKSRKESFVYVISNHWLESISLNPLHYRARLMEALPEGATIRKILLRELENNATLTELSMPERPLAELPLEDETAIRTAQLSGLVRRFEVKEYLPGPFREKGSIQGNEHIPWHFELAAEIALPGGDSNITEKRSYLFSERLGGTTQIGGTASFDALFKLNQRMIDLIHALAQNPNPSTTPER